MISQKNRILFLIFMEKNNNFNLEMKFKMLI